MFVLLVPNELSPRVDVRCFIRLATEEMKRAVSLTGTRRPDCRRKTGRDGHADRGVCPLEFGKSKRQPLWWRQKIRRSVRTGKESWATYKLHGAYLKYEGCGQDRDKMKPPRRKH